MALSRRSRSWRSRIHIRSSRAALRHRFLCSPEPLEDRRLLSLASVDYGQPDPTWFAAVDLPYGPKTLEEAAVAAAAASDPTPASRILPPCSRWMVQLSEESLANVATVADARQTLDVGGTHFAIIRGLGMPGQMLVCAPGISADVAKSALSANPHVSTFAPDELIQGQVIPNDPQFTAQTALHNTGQQGGTVDADIDAPEAWNIATGTSAVVVAVIDSGIDYAHPDLAGNIWTNPGEIAGNGLDDDANGFVDDVHGYDFRNDDGDPLDDYWHGTHVAGIIAAEGNNGQGISGVAWDGSLMALKFLGADNQGTVANAVRAINYATMMRTRTVDPVNVRVLNASWVTADYNANLHDAIATAGEQDILFVTAAGNGDAYGNGIDLDQYPVYPACFDLDNIIAVASSNGQDQLAVSSNYGQQSVDLAAPGVNVLSTVPGGGYADHDGTSMATPHVSGTAALIWSNVPGATASEVREAILDGTDPKTVLAGRLSTGGRLNAFGALLRDTNKPTAALTSAPDITTIGGTYQEITVTYTDNLAIDLASLDDTDLVVTRLNGAGEVSGVTLARVSPLYNGSPRVVTYHMPAPGGRWDMFDCGEYQIRLRGGQVADTQGNHATSTVLGTFRVDLSVSGTFLVSTFEDAPDASPGNGLAEDSQGRTTLRAALQELNVRAGTGTIILDAGTYTLSVAGADEQLSAKGDLDVAQVISIVGAGADRTTMDAQALDRLFDIVPGGELTLSGVRLTGGAAPATTNGGAVRNLGRLDLSQSTVDTNNAENGGAIYIGADATATITASTIHHNTATTDAGAIYNEGHLSATNVTISGNVGARQGGIYNKHDADADFINCTIVDNSSQDVNRGEPLRVGGEQLVNFNASWGELPDVAVDGAGNFMVVWREGLARRFSGDGRPLSDEFRFNDPATEVVNNIYAAVAANADGDWVVAWPGGTWIGSTWYYRIYAQRLAGTGAKLGPRIEVDSGTGGLTYTDVAMAADGTFVVVWTEYAGSDGNGKGVYGRRYDAEGVPLGDRFLVNTTTEGDQLVPAVDVNSTNGEFVVAWEGNGTSDSSGVFARRFDCDGTPLGTEFLVNTFTGSGQSRPDIAVWPDGRFTIAYGSALDVMGGVYVQRYASDGNKVGGEQHVNVYTAGAQGEPSIAIAPDGGFVVAWTDGGHQDGDFLGVYARRFDAAAQPTSGEFRVNTTTLYNQKAPALAIGPDGSMIIVRDGAGGNRGGGVFLQSYALFAYNGGMYSEDGGRVSLGNTIVAGNTAGHPSPDLLGGYETQGHNLVGVLGDAVGIIPDQRGDLVDPQARFSLGTLHDNGGATWTHALLPGSPAIDAGDVALAPTTDQRSVVRPQDGDDDGHAVVDIGAFERTPADGQTPADGAGSGDDIGGSSHDDIGRDAGTAALAVGDIGWPSGIDGTDIGPAVSGDLADFGPLVRKMSSATASWAVSPIWFTGVPQLASPSGLPAPADETCEVDGWIVQLDSATAGSVGVLTDVTAFLADAHVRFQVRRGLGYSGLVLVESPHEQRAAAFRSLRANPHIIWFEADAVISGQQVPNDPLFDQQTAWYNAGQHGGTPGADFDAPAAWDITTGSPDVVIAVLDSGIDYDHPDLAANIWVNPAEIPANGIDDDNNGLIDDVNGYDFANDDADPMDDCGHGTAISGVIAAAGNNGLGMAGVNWQASLMALKFLDENNQGTVSNAVRAINYATMMRTRGENPANVRVINNSWSMNDPSAGLYDAIQLSSQADLLFVTAAGNGDRRYVGLDVSQQPVYPGCYDLDNILNITASDPDDSLAAFSNFSPTDVDLAAPGVDVLTTQPGNTYAAFNGTSLAAAQVTGVAALVWAKAPNALADDVRRAIHIGAEAQPGLTGRVATGARLSAFGALTADTTPPWTTLVSAPDIAAGGEAFQDIVVQIEDDHAVGVATLDNADLVVTRLNFDGAAADCALQSVTPVNDGSPRTAVYRMSAPGGSWDVMDNGVYQVRLRENAIGDTSDNTNSAVILGTFQVSVTATGYIWVDSYEDATDIQPGDGISDDGNGRSTLRGAIQELSALGGGTVLLDGGRYVLSLTGYGEDANQQGDLDITSSITVIGGGADRTRIDAASLDRVFDVHLGGVLNVNGATVTGGLLPDLSEGGGIRNHGALTLANCHVTANVSGNGGGIYNAADATAYITSTLIAANEVQAAVEELRPGGYASMADGTGSAWWVNRAEPVNRPAVAGNDAGSYVAVWESRHMDPRQILAQRFDPYGPIGVDGGYDPTGRPMGEIIAVTSPADIDPRQADIAVDANGDFTVVWQDYADRSGANGREIYAQRYHADGTPWGPRTLVNQSHQSGNQTDAAVAASANGSFIIVWMDSGSDGSGSGVFGQLFDRNGTRVGGEFQVNSWTTDDQRYPRAAMDADGNFVVVWDGNNQDGNGRGVFGQRYDTDGAPRGEEFRVNSTVAGDQERPTLNMDTDGDFVVVWQSNGQDGSGYGIYAQRFDLEGRRLGDEFRVNTYVDSDQTNPVIAGDSAGNFIISWTSAVQDGDGSGVFAQLFNRYGVPQGTEFMATETNYDSVFYASRSTVVLDDRGNCAFVWISEYNGRSNYFSTRQFRQVFHAHDGGGLYNDGTASVVDSTISANTAPRHGGIYNSHSATLTLEYSTVVDNVTLNVATQGALALGSEQLVNTQSLPSSNPDIAADASGRYVITWQDTAAIRARRYDNQHLPLGEEIQVSAAAELSEADPAVAVNSQGEFIVVWSASETGDSRSRVYAQRFTSTGIPEGARIEIQPPETAVTVRNPDVALMDDGKWMVAWVNASGGDGSGYGVYGRLFDGSVALGAPFVVNHTTFGNQDFPAVAVGIDGTFTVAWECSGVGNYEIRSQRFDRHGSATGPEVIVNHGLTGQQRYPAIAAQTDGGFVVAFQDDCDNGKIAVQRYDSTGDRVRVEFPANTFHPVSSSPSYRIQSPAVAVADDGQLLVAWEIAEDPGVWRYKDVVLRVYEPSGAPRGDELRITAPNTVQGNPNVAFIDQNTIIVVWEGDGQGVSGKIFAQTVSVATCTGGVANAAGGVVHLTDSVLAGNVAPHGSLDVLGDFATASHNLLTTVGVATGIVAGSDGNIVDADARATLGALQDNGGTTWTHELLLGSPALDAADPASMPETDQRGITRPQDADYDGTALPDIGAFERYHGAIQGTWFRDLDGDAIQDVNEPGLGGLLVFLDANANSAFDLDEPWTLTRQDDPTTADVDEAGHYAFTQLTPGPYLVAAAVLPGWFRTSPSSGTHAVTIRPGEILANIDFADDAPLGSISGQVFHDEDGNGQWGAGEFGLAGWQVFLDYNANGVLNPGEPSVLTDDTGGYQFQDIISAAYYTVSMIQQDGWERTLPRPVDDGVWSITLGPGERRESIDFGVRNLSGMGQANDGALEGVVYVDTDGDGVHDAHEPGLAGWTVYIDVNNNRQLDPAEVARSVTTATDNPATPTVDETGRYRIQNLPAGNYRVRLVPQDGYAQSRPIGNLLEPVVYPLAVNARPQAVAVADLNGDAWPDVASANASRNDVAVLLGDGTALGSATYVAAGLQPTAVVAADFDGDGDQDLAVTDYYGTTLTLLLNAGDATFPVTRSIPAGQCQRALVAGDIDHDGDQDLVVVNELPYLWTGTVSVLRNAGNGTFAAPITLAAGASPYAAVLAQLNDDNQDGQLTDADWLDLAVANIDDNTVSIYWNTAGTFGAPTHLPVAWGPASLAAGDVDGNGTVDLVVANAFANRLEVLRNNGNKTFAAPAAIPLATGPFAVTVGDIEGDGDLDLLATVATVPHLLLLRNTNGSWEPPEPFGVGDFPISAVYSVFLADVNADGMPDPVVAVGDDSRSEISVVSNYLGPGAHGVKLDGSATRSGLDFPLVTTAMAEVVGRHIFYNNSKWDAHTGYTSGDPAANAFDDGAIASDKQALRNGQQAKYANYTNFSRGINGIMIDIAGLADPAGLTAADFEFRTGNNGSPAGWSLLALDPTLITIAVRPGAGVAGSDRVTMLFPDGAVKKTWLQVTVKATDATGLAVPDVHYWGNAIGDSGNSATDTAVNVVDALGVRANPHTLLKPAPIDDAYDYNRDKQVNVQDELIVRANPTTLLTDLNLIDLTGAEGEAGGGRLEAGEGEEPGRSEIHDLAFSELLEDWAQEDGL